MKPYCHLCRESFTDEQQVITIVRRTGASGRFHEACLPKKAAAANEKKNAERRLQEAEAPKPL